MIRNKQDLIIITRSNLENVERIIHRDASDVTMTVHDHKVFEKVCKKIQAAIDELDNVG